MRNSSEEKYELIKPKCKLSEIELNENLRKSIDEILEDRKFEHALKREKLTPRKMILLYGPPGCGKTSIAHAIAAETGLPLYLANGAQIISAYVGESSKHAEQVFRFANEKDCVMLVDEFDSFARSRQKSASYEIRLVNTLLVNMEMRPPQGIMIACTNFDTDIDPAILRRFDMILEVPHLSREALIKVAETALDGRFGISAEECVNEGLTPSGTVRAAKNKLRAAVLASERANPTPKPASRKRKEPEELTGDVSMYDYQRAQMDYMQARMAPSFPVAKPFSFGGYQSIPTGNGGWTDEARDKIRIPE